MDSNTLKVFMRLPGIGERYVDSLKNTLNLRELSTTTIYIWYYNKAYRSDMVRESL